MGEGGSVDELVWACVLCGERFRIPGVDHSAPADLSALAYAGAGHLDEHEVEVEGEGEIVGFYVPAGTVAVARPAMTA